MSIRKVSDLESVSFSDGSQELSDINDSLIEVSFPQHTESGHSYKSMKVRYEDIRSEIGSSIFSSEDIKFAKPVEFEDTVTFNKTLNMPNGFNVQGNVNANTENFCISGNLSVNANEPNWASKHIYMRAGDIAFYSKNNVSITSDRNIYLSSNAIHAYANLTYLKSYNGQQDIATFNTSQIQFTPDITCTGNLRIPTSDKTNDKDAVNVELLNETETTLKEYIDSSQESNNFRLIETNLYGPNDILNIQYMLEKKYQLVENETTSYFLEYDLKSEVLKTASDKLIYFPEILDVDSTSITLSKVFKPEASGTNVAGTTTIKLIPIIENESYKNYIAALSAGGDIADNSERTLNAHIFSKVADLSKITGGSLLDMDFKDATDMPEDTALYAFATNAFSTKKNGTTYQNFAITITGNLGISGITGAGQKILVYAAFSKGDVPDSNPNLYSGMGTRKDPAEKEEDLSIKYPIHERMYAQKKSNETFKELDDDNIGNADNGYKINDDSDRDKIIYSYAERYAYELTNGTEITETGTVKTEKNKKFEIDGKYFKQIGLTTVYKKYNTIQLRKIISLANSVYEDVKSMRIIFATQDKFPDTRIWLMSDKSLKVSVQGIA